MAVSSDSVITFNTVSGAESYIANVYKGSVLKYSQTVASGDVLHFFPFADADYSVKVIAHGYNILDSEESSAYTWSLLHREIDLGSSEYCEAEKSSGNTIANFTWETNNNGDVVITISEADGGDAGTTHFRGNGMALANFTVGNSNTAASTWFNHVHTAGTSQITLQLKDANNAPDFSEKIHFNAVVEYATSKDGNAWPTLSFDYTYGTVCSGKSVSATPNNNTMGTATVKAGGVDVTSVESGTSVTFTATSADAELYEFVNWTKGGVAVSTNASYTTTITETTNLVANFDYVRNTYCHYAITSNSSAVQGKKLYMTIGSIGGGDYTIKFEGSAEAPLTGLQDANYVINNVTAKTVVDGQPTTGADVPFTKTNGRWNFDATGYGKAWIVFSLANGKTIDDIFVWANAIFFNTASGVLGYEDNQNRMGLFGNPAPLRHNIAWNSTCADETAPVLTTPTATALNTTDVRLTLSATDNWEGLITYNISYKPTGVKGAGTNVEVTGASGATVTKDITGLTTNTAYTFSVTASDGTNTSAAQSCSATPAGDVAAPTGLTVTAHPLSTSIIRLTLFANDDYAGDITYNISYDNAGEASTSAARGESTTFDITGLTANTEYHFSVTATDAASNTSSAVNAAAVRTFATNLALNKPATAGHETGNAGEVKEKSNDGNKGTRWSSYGSTNKGTLDTEDWWAVNLGAVYDIKNIRLSWQDARSDNLNVYTSMDGDTWTLVQNFQFMPTSSANGETYTNYELTNAIGRYVKVLSLHDSFSGQWGISFWEFEAYGSPAVDAVAPVITSFTAAGASPTSVLVQATADDNFKGNLTYTFYCNNVQQGEPVVKAVGEEATCTVTGLSMGTNYNFKVTVSDGSNTTTSDVVVASPVGDTEAPTSVTVATQSVTDNTIVLRLTAIDDLGGIIYYTVTSGSTVKNVEAVSGNNVDVTFDGLNYSTTYNFSVVAKDGADNASAAVAHSETTLRAPYPTSAAPTPATHSSLVVPVYSSAFNKNCNFADWGGSTVIKETYGAKKNNYAASYFGIVDFGTISVTADAELYLSVWTNENIRFRIVPIIHNDAETANLPERGAYTQTLTGGEWNIVHIRLGDFNLNNNTVAEPNENYNKIYQIKIDNAGNQTFWLDNIYFAKEPPVLALDETSDNSDVISENNDKYVNVTLNRSFTNTEMTYTLCLPFDMSAEQLTEAFGAGWRLSKLSEDSYYKSGDAIRMIFDRASSLEAGVPYLFTPGASTAAPVGIEGVVINSAAPDAIGNNVVKMKGFYEPTALPDDGKDNWFLGTDSYLHKASVSAYSFRAYFILGASVPAGVRARVVMRGEETDMATDLDAVMTDSPAEKFFRDGQLLIRKNGVTYTVLGIKAE